MSARDPLGQLLRVKQVREQRQMARLNIARSAERTATTARIVSEATHATHETGRTARESAIYGGLTGDALPGHRVQAAGAELAALQSRSVTLGHAARSAAEAAEICLQAAAAAQRAHSTALRERTGAETLVDQRTARFDAQQERRDEADLEEAASSLLAVTRR